MTQEKIMNILDAEAARGRTVVATTHDRAARFVAYAPSPPPHRRRSGNSSPPVPLEGHTQRALRGLRLVRRAPQSFLPTDA
ncbi:MAG: hypothetical protein ACKOJD_04235 [Candidatus Limnocylindrus sp.]